jgi:hypothetical protein
MSSGRGRHSPSPVTGDGLSRRFKALDLSQPKQKISKLFSKPPFLDRWAAISRHDPYLKQANHQGQSSGHKPPPTVPQGSGQAPSQPVCIYQAPPYPPPDLNARPPTPPHGLPRPPALIPMPEPSVNYAPNNTRPLYDQPPLPGGFVAPGAYLVGQPQAPYIAVPYPSGERVRAS